MKTSGFTFVLSASLALAMTACSTTPITPKSTLRDTVLNSHIAVTPIVNPAQLSERTKAQAIGNFVVSSAVGSLAASGGGAVNAQQMQANMQIAQSFNQNLQHFT